MKRLLFTLLLITPFIVNAQRLSSEELLQKSIDFHDPEGKWSMIDLQLVIDMVSPNGATRASKVSINNAKGTFELRAVNKGIETMSKVDELDSCSFTVNYRPVTDKAQADSLRLTPYFAKRMRDYYSFLYGLPMKLKDNGTIIDPNVQRTTFQDKPVFSFKVTYDETVGTDIWYFYFHTETYAMVGYRFFHDESVNDGEYITLEGMTIQNGMRLPKDRSWYMNIDDKLLGTDYLISMEIKN
jgi:hypothetical protein